MTVADDRQALERFPSTDPATGEVIATWPIDDERSIAETVDRARLAAQWWADLGFAGRRERLLAWRGVLARRVRQLGHLMHRENGKPLDDATLEAILAIDHLDWAAKHARKVLGPRTVRPSLLSANQQAWLEYQPLGVIGVIGPWNYPVFTPMGSIAYALAAGNAVVFKPSEYTPGVGAWLVETFAEVVPEQPVLQLVTGFGATGAALCRSGVDKVAFTGSTATGKKVMSACAERLTPVLVECGGKDALIVDADADLDAAADAAAWGGLSNAGQTCTGIERVFVADAVYEPFLAKLVERVRELRPGSDPHASYGPITMPSQVDVIRRHIEEAIERGGRAVVGGPQAVRPPFVDPVVLVDVPEDSPANTEETFGPTLSVTRVRDVDEAVDRVNGGLYGLGAAVFAKRRGMELARRLRTGMTSVNSAISFATVPALPFGGVADSGFGRIHGADGLKEFTRAKAITRQRFGLPVPLTSFDRAPETVDRIVWLVGVLYGRRR
ncbi:MAG: aldehyde dehydrogenase family protein [Actinomycetia bacterium]|nr:aldehyde dehydrogenase family protein [Actinomycetes bacterium]